MIWYVTPSSESRRTSFGALLRAYRQRATVTQQELAQRAGLSPKAVGALERGDRRLPHPRTIRALAQALELTDAERAALHASVRDETADEWHPQPGTTPAGTAPDRVGPSADASQRAAAWELYVELVTRITVVELPPDQGLLRDALNSLHSLFDTTRRILRTHGPAVLERPETGAANVGSLALQVLNEEVRPLLAEWHPPLLDHETRRPLDVSLAAHERAWERSVELRRALFDLQTNLHGHARHLAAIAGVPNPPGLDERQGPASAAEP